MIPINDLTSPLLNAHLEEVSSIIASRIAEYWLNTERFDEEQLVVSGITGLGATQSDNPHEVVVNYHSICFAANGVHRFLYYTTEESLEKSLNALLAGEEDPYDPAEDYANNDPSDGGHAHSDDMETRHVFDDPTYFEELNIQPIDAIEDWSFNYLLGSALDAMVWYSGTGDNAHLQRAIGYLVRETQTTMEVDGLGT